MQNEDRTDRGHAGTIEIKNGQMVAPDRPGVGCELDEDKLKYY
jgi:L-alanine-DL-glutamate epimerase-like enolase superfamily enzyme